MGKPAIHLAEALGHDASDKRIDILRRIGMAGSISEAARGAGVSYKAAWQALDTLGNLAGAALVERTVGGAGGGGARLTRAGEELLRAADALALARAQALARLSGGERSGLAALGLRTSMRNQVRCQVLSLGRSGAVVRVQLEIAGGGLVVSRVTHESAQLLALRPAQEVLALFKATAVHVSAQAAEQPGVNRVYGRVVRVSRAAAGGEAALELPGGQRLVGLAGAGHGLRLGQSCAAAVEESAVAIAVTG